MAECYVIHLTKDLEGKYCFVLQAIAVTKWVEEKTSVFLIGCLIHLQLL